MLKLTTDKHEALRGLSATAELLVLLALLFRLQILPLRTIKLFSVLFSGVSVHAAGRDKQTFAGASPTVRSRPTTLHGLRQLFLSLCSSHVQQSSIASYYTRIAICAYTPTHLTPPLGGSRRNIAAPFSTEKLKWRGYPRVKKFRRYVYSL